MAKLERTQERLDALIKAGQQVLVTSQAPGEGIIGDNYVDSVMFYEWKAASLSFVSYLFGERHTHYRLLNQGCQDPCEADTLKGLGVLNAAKQDIEGGFLVSLKSLVAADLFADFIEMADHLLEAGYKDAAAVLIGGVLEEHLRRLCSANRIVLTEASKPKRADRLNADLAKASVYNMLDHKSVTSWLDLRNKAAHAEYDSYSPEQVRLMLHGVHDFVARTLS